jgi:urea carboxylase
MDDKNFLLANLILDNPPGASALELTLLGPTLRFTCDATIALTGAEMEALVDGEAIAHNRPVNIKAGQILVLGAISGPGQRAYLAVRGGFKASRYLGSTATFALGGFGGHTGHALRAGDTLRLNPATSATTSAQIRVPELTHNWQLAVRYGPHGAPDFFTDADIQTLFDSTYEVHHNSARTGVSSAPSPAGRGPMAARPGCILPTFTTTPTPSAPSISPATCQSF